MESTQETKHTYSVNDYVEYHPLGGAHGRSTSKGIIKQVITSDQEARVHHYLILNEHTLKESAVTPESLIRVIRPRYQEQQRVKYRVGGHETTGTISKVMVKPEVITVEIHEDASLDNPKYVIKNDTTGREYPISHSAIVEALNE